MKLIPVGFLFVHFICSSLLFGGEYIDDSLHFTFTLPTGWEMIPYETVKEHEQQIKADIGADNAKFSYDGALDLQSSEFYFEYPHVIYEYVQMPDLLKKYSFSQVTEVMIESINPNAIRKYIDTYKMNDLIADYDLSTVIVDDKNYSLFYSMIMEIANVGNIKGIVGMYFGKEGLIKFYCYSTEKDFDKYLPSFKILFNTFKFQKGYEFADVPTSNKLEYDFTVDESFGKTTLKGLAIIVIIIIAVIVLNRNAKNKIYNINMEKHFYDKEKVPSAKNFTKGQFEGDENKILDYEELDDSGLSDEEKAKVYGKLFGLSGSLKKTDITKIYRKLVGKYHPDKVSHLGKEFQIFAEKKTKDINKAYHYFKSKYNL